MLCPLPINHWQDSGGLIDIKNGLAPARGGFIWPQSQCIKNGRLHSLPDFLMPLAPFRHIFGLWRDFFEKEIYCAFPPKSDVPLRRPFVLRPALLLWAEKRDLEIEFSAAVGPPAGPPNCCSRNRQFPFTLAVAIFERFQKCRANGKMLPANIYVFGRLNEVLM